MLKIDLHIHTLHSGHAYGSFYDIVNEARRKKMKIIAITDHGPNMLGSATRMHFGMGHRSPQFKDLKVLWGCESNIIDADGNIDLSERLQKKLDVLLVGFHDSCDYKDLGIKKNTEAVIKALKNPHVHVLTHPTHLQFPYDFEKVCKAAIDNDVLLELNTSYLKQNPQDMAKFKRLVEIVKKAGKKLIVNTDTHFIHEVGDDSILKKHWKELGLSKELIINNYPDELMKFLKKGR